MLTRLRSYSSRADWPVLAGLAQPRVALTDAFDALRHLGVLSEGFTLASSNLNLVRKTVGAHGGPALDCRGAVWRGVCMGARCEVLRWRGWSAAALLIAAEATVNQKTAGPHKSTLIARLARGPVASRG